MTPLWHLLALEGLRKGEALALRWRDIDLDRGTAQVALQIVVMDKSAGGKARILPRGKTASAARNVRLTQRTIAALREHKKRQNETRLAASQWTDHDLIVCTRSGAPINPRNVSRSFDALLDAARLPDGSSLPRIRVHDLRHSAATALLRAGVSPRIVADRLGHSGVNITLNVYSHVTGDMQEGAALAMDRAMDAAMCGAE